MLVVACVAIIVVGPKDLPKMLRTVGKTVANLRRMAGDFQKQFDDAVREADLDEVRNIAKGKGFAPLEDVKNSAKAFQDKVREEMAGTKKEMEAVGKAINADADKLPDPKSGGGSGSKSGTAKTAETMPVAKTKTAKTKPAAKKSAAKTTATKAATKKTPAKKPKAATGKSA